MEFSKSRASYTSGDADPAPGVAVCHPSLLVIAVVAVALFTGCAAVIPTNYYQAGSRTNLNDKTRSTLQLGTTKDEVFLRLGEPDFVSENGQTVGYAWSKVKALWFIAVGGPYSAVVTGGEVAK